MNEFEQARELKAAVQDIARPGAVEAAAIARIKSSASALLVSRLAERSAITAAHVEWSAETVGGFADAYLSDLRLNLSKGSIITDEAWSAAIDRGANAIAGDIARTLNQMAVKALDRRKKAQGEIGVERRW